MCTCVHVRECVCASRGGSRQGGDEWVASGQTGKGPLEPQGCKCFWCPAPRNLGCALKPSLTVCAAAGAAACRKHRALQQALPTAAQHCHRSKTQAPKGQGHVAGSTGLPSMPQAALTEGA